MDVQLVRTNQTKEVEIRGRLSRWMGLNLAVDYWWMKPIYGQDISEIPSTIQLFVGEYQSKITTRYLIAIPAVNQSAKGKLSVRESRLYLESVYGQTDQNLVIGSIVYDCESILMGIEKAMKGLTKEIEGFQLRTKKKTPSYYDELGWCTWDVFYRDVSEANILRAFETFKQRGIQPSYLILDDGWQDVTDMYLKTIFENEKFPAGLKRLVSLAKKTYGFKQVGIWHALQGYWGGIDPTGPLAHSFSLKRNDKILPSPYTTYFTDKGYYISETDIGGFYEMFYSFLKECGIDLVKVDSQGSLLHLCENEENPTAIMSHYQKALTTVGKKYFNNEILYCMAHSSDIIFNTNEFIAWRNSDDFFPDKPLASQLEHLYVNAINNIFTSTFAFPDWDMFQTQHPYAQLHALIRAISGGPLYICDAPEQINQELLSKLMINEQQVLRFRQPALPFEACIMTDTLTTKTLLKIHNHSDFGFTVMSANLNPDFKSIKETLMIEELAKSWKIESWIYFSHDLNSIGHICIGEGVGQTLEYGQYTYLSFVPQYEKITPLGNIDKYNAYLVIKSIMQVSNQMTIECQGRGRFACYLEEDVKIKSLQVNGILHEAILQHQLLIIHLNESENLIQVTMD